MVKWMQASLLTLKDTFRVSCCGVVWPCIWFDSWLSALSPWFVMLSFTYLLYSCPSLPPHTAPLKVKKKKKAHHKKPQTPQTRHCAQNNRTKPLKTQRWTTKTHTCPQIRSDLSSSEEQHLGTGNTQTTINSFSTHAFIFCGNCHEMFGN